MRRRQPSWVWVVLIQVSLLAFWANGGSATAGEIAVRGDSGSLRASASNPASAMETATEASAPTGAGCEHCPQCPGGYCPSTDCATPCSPAATPFSLPAVAVFLTSLTSVDANPPFPPSILYAPLHPPPIR